VCKVVIKHRLSSVTWGKGACTHY